MTLPAISRPVLRYYGGGWTRAPWTVSYFPPHDVYCEPCFGAGSIMLRKRPARREIANDLDGRVMNFFEVLRRWPEELVRAINLTPWHEGEYQRCLLSDTNGFEDARRFFFTCWASISGGPAMNAGSFRWTKVVDRRSSPASDIVGLDHLYEAAVRLKEVQFLQKDALDVIGRMAGSEALIYFDPPYVRSTRNSSNYNHEPDDDWHAAAADLLNAHDGPVIVAGYRSNLYADLYEAHGWRRVERTQRTNSGSIGRECLWLSPLCETPQPSLFDLAAITTATNKGRPPQWESGATGKGCPQDRELSQS